MVISILVFRLFQSSEFLTESMRWPASSGLMKSGSLFPVLGEITLLIGVCSNLPFLTKYLKKDFSVDIFRLIVMEPFPFYLMLASQLRINERLITFTDNFPNCNSR